MKNIMYKSAIANGKVRMSRPVLAAITANQSNDFSTPFVELVIQELVGLTPGLYAVR